MRWRRGNAYIGLAKFFSQVQLVEMESTGKGFRVQQYAVIDYLPDGERWAVAQVKEALAQKRFRATMARAAVSGPSVQHRTLTLPPMTAQEMDIVIQRQVGHEAASASERFAYDFEILGELQERGVKRHEILVVSAPRQMAETQRSFVEQCGLRPQSLSTIPLALFNLLEAMGPETTQWGAGFLYLSYRTGYLVIANRGRFQFSREFPLGGEAWEESLAWADVRRESADTIVNELNRLLLFYTQQFGGAEPEKLILGGEGDLEAIKKTLETNLGLRVEVFNPTTTLDVTPLGGGRAEFQERAPALAIAIGLAMRRDREHTIDLLPRDLQARRRGLAGKIAAGVVAAGFLALLGMEQQRLAARLAPLRQTLRALQGEQAALRPRWEELQRVQQERAYAQAGQHFLEQARWITRFWPEVLRELAALTPREIRLQSVEVTRGPEGYQMILKGEAMSKDVPAAVAALTQFYPQLRKSPFFADLVPQFPPAAGGSSLAVEAIKLPFVITGKLRLKPLLPPG